MPPTSSRGRAAGGASTGAGSAISGAGDAVEQRAAPGAPVSQLRPGARIPPKRLAEHPHDQAPGGAGQPGQPGQRRRGAANSSHRPMPTWIQTAAAPAWTGW